MPNQRKEGIARISVTMADQLLAALEAEAGAAGSDRLEIIRDALTDYLTKKGRLPKSGSSAKKETPKRKRTGRK